MMFLATMINYMDRNTLSTTQQFILSEFVPSSSVDASAPDAKAQLESMRTRVYGNVLVAFGISFAFFQIVAGYLVDRFSLRKVYLMAIIIWSAAGVLTGFIPAGAIEMLILCRIMLGIGEAFNWPCAVGCVRRVIPRESRGLANGIFHSGGSIGAVATPLLVLLLVNTTTGEGWRTLFIVVGAVGFLWAVGWMFITRGERAIVIDSTPQPDPGFETQGPTPSFFSVLWLPKFWICLTTGVCVNLCWHFYGQWFPRYLSQEIEASGRGQQWIIAGFFIAADLGSMTCGWLTRRFARAGKSVERSRQWVMTLVAISALSATATAVSLPMEMLWAKYLAFFFVGASAIGGFTIFFSLAQDIVPRHTAQILGVCGFASWMVISGAADVAGSYAKKGVYGELFLAVSAFPMLAALVGWCWPSPVQRESPATPKAVV